MYDICIIYMYYICYIIDIYYRYTYIYILDYYLAYVMPLTILNACR